MKIEDIEKKWDSFLDENKFKIKMMLNPLPMGDWSFFVFSFIIESYNSFKEIWSKINNWVAFNFQNINDLKRIERFNINLVFFVDFKDMKLNEYLPLIKDIQYNKYSSRKTVVSYEKDMDIPKYIDNWFFSIGEYPKSDYKVEKFSFKEKEFNVKESDFIAIYGSNGIGKTRLINSLNPEDIRNFKDYVLDEKDISNENIFIKKFKPFDTEIQSSLFWARSDKIIYKICGFLECSLKSNESKTLVFDSCLWGLDSINFLILECIFRAILRDKEIKIQIILTTSDESRYKLLRTNLYLKSEKLRFFRLGYNSIEED